jgi:hypothetical protein
VHLFSRASLKKKIKDMCTGVNNGTFEEPVSFTFEESLILPGGKNRVNIDPVFISASWWLCSKKLFAAMWSQRS